MIDESIWNSRVLIKLGFQIGDFWFGYVLNEIDSAIVLIKLLSEGLKCQFD